MNHYPKIQPVYSLISVNFFTINALCQYEKLLLCWGVLIDFAGRFVKEV